MQCRLLTRPGRPVTAAILRRAPPAAPCCCLLLPGRAVLASPAHTARRRRRGPWGMCERTAPMRCARPGSLAAQAGARRARHRSSPPRGLGLGRPSWHGVSRRRMAFVSHRMHRRRCSAVAVSEHAGAVSHRSTAAGMGARAPAAHARDMAVLFSLLCVPRRGSWGCPRNHLTPLPREPREPRRGRRSPRAGGTLNTSLQLMIVIQSPALATTSGAAQTTPSLCIRCMTEIAPAWIAATLCSHHAAHGADLDRVVTGAFTAQLVKVCL